jgi:GRASP55/65 PDZ-like domain
MQSLGVSSSSSSSSSLLLLLLLSLSLLNTHSLSVHYSFVVLEIRPCPQVESKSPAADAGLCPYFDFIVRANDEDLSVDPVGGTSPFVTLLQQSVGTAIKLTVFNLRTDLMRGIQ